MTPMSTICPKCLEDATITVRVDDGDTLVCGGCEQEFSVDDIVALVESWTPLLPWLQSHPARESVAPIKLA